MGALNQSKKIKETDLIKDLVQNIKQCHLKKTILPALQYTKIIVEPNSTTLINTDLEVAHKTTITISLDTKFVGTYLVNTTVLINTLNLRKSFVYALEQCLSNLNDSMQNNIDDFPTLPLAGFNKVADFVNMNSMFDVVRFAASKDTAKHILNTINLKYRNGRLNVATTDGYRLCVLKKELIIAQEDDIFNEGFDINVPSRLKLNKLFNYNLAVQMNLIDKQIEQISLTNIIQSGRIDYYSTIYVRLVDGQYPDYNRIIPHGLDKSITLTLNNAKQLVDELKYCVKSCEDKVVVVTISAVEPDIVNFTVDSPNFKHNFVINAKNDLPKDFTILFNSKHLQDSIDAIVKSGLCDHEMKLSLGASLSPMIINASINSSYFTNNSYFHMLMPLRF